MNVCILRGSSCWATILPWLRVAVVKHQTLLNLVTHQRGRIMAGVAGENWDGRSRTDTDRRWQSQPEEWAEDTPPQPKRNRWGRSEASSSFFTTWPSPCAQWGSTIGRCTTSLHESTLSKLGKPGQCTGQWVLVRDTRLRLYGEGADERLIGQMIASLCFPSQWGQVLCWNGCYWTSRWKLSCTTTCACALSKQTCQACLEAAEKEMRIWWISFESFSLSLRSL